MLAQTPPVPRQALLAAVDDQDRTDTTRFLSHVGQVPAARSLLRRPVLRDRDALTDALFHPQGTCGAELGRPATAPRAIMSSSGTVTSAESVTFIVQGGARIRHQGSPQYLDPRRCLHLALCPTAGTLTVGRPCPPFLHCSVTGISALSFGIIQ